MLLINFFLINACSPHYLFFPSTTPVHPHICSHSAQTVHFSLFSSHLLFPHLFSLLLLLFNSSSLLHLLLLTPPPLSGVSAKVSQVVFLLTELKFTLPRVMLVLNMLKVIIQVKKSQNLSIIYPREKQLCINKMKQELSSPLS